ncbi:hypothetical protein J31TS4_10020 [Paenibacillus sp. J31TS4]|nr:hypothetical protein J31TS4_10020 [Paenibacillus sp. J31TS4]
MRCVTKPEHDAKNILDEQYIARVKGTDIEWYGSMQACDDEDNCKKKEGVGSLKPGSFFFHSPREEQSRGRPLQLPYPVPPFYSEPGSS